MSTYLDLLDESASIKTFSRKIDYIRFNFKKHLKFDISHNAKILEIGPGLGEAVKYLNDRGFENIDIIDNDQGVINYINQTFKIRKSFFAEKLDEIENSLEMYDAIIATQVLEHIPKESHEAFLRILYNHLNKGGKMIITAPNMANPFTLFEKYGDITHEIGFTDSSFKQLSIKCDIPIKDIEIRGFNIPPYTMINLIRIPIQKILHAFILICYIANGGGYSRILTPNITLIVKK